MTGGVCEVIFSGSWRRSGAPLLSPACEGLLLKNPLGIFRLLRHRGVCCPKTAERFRRTLSKLRRSSVGRKLVNWSIINKLKQMVYHSTGNNICYWKFGRNFLYVTMLFRRKQLVDFGPWCEKIWLYGNVKYFGLFRTILSSRAIQLNKRNIMPHVWITKSLNCKIHFWQWTFGFGRTISFTSLGNFRFRNVWYLSTKIRRRIIVWHTDIGSRFFTLQFSTQSYPRKSRSTTNFYLSAID